ncbi:hypothetical protein BDW71DRAFT_81736 [Aspergillus fruticulosus]
MLPGSSWLAARTLSVSSSPAVLPLLCHAPFSSLGHPQEGLYCLLHRCVPITSHLSAYSRVSTATWKKESLDVVEISKINRSAMVTNELFAQ